MKKSISSIKNKIVSRYSVEDQTMDEPKSTNINILLNRVKLDQKKENRKKILFSAATCTGFLILGTLIF